jgi:hypothetical protein
MELFARKVAPALRRDSAKLFEEQFGAIGEERAAERAL